MLVSGRVLIQSYQRFTSLHTIRLLSAHRRIASAPVTAQKGLTPDASETDEDEECRSVGGIYIYIHTYIYYMCVKAEISLQFQGGYPPQLSTDGSKRSRDEVRREN